MIGKEHAPVGQGRGGDAVAEEAPAGDPGEPAIEAVAAGNDGGRQAGRAATPQVRERDGGGLGPARQLRQQAGAEGGVGAADDEAAGALVLALDEGEGAAGAGGRFLEAAEVEGAQLEAAELTRDAQPEVAAAPQLYKGFPQGGEVLVDGAGAGADPALEERAGFVERRHAAIVRPEGLFP